MRGEVVTVTAAHSDGEHDRGDQGEHDGGEPGDDDTEFDGARRAAAPAPDSDSDPATAPAQLASAARRWQCGGLGGGDLEERDCD